MKQGTKGINPHLCTLSVGDETGREGYVFRAEPDLINLIYAHIWFFPGRTHISLEDSPDTV